MATRTKTTADDESLDGVIVDAPPQSKGPEPIIDLDALEEARDTVRLKGVLYELHAAHEFGAIEQHRLERDNREFRTLQGSEHELTEDQEQRLDMLVERIFEKVLIAPAAVKRKMTGPQKAAVVSAFSYAPVVKLARLRAAIEQQQAPQAGDDSTTAS